MSRAAFFKARNGKPDANAKAIKGDLESDGHVVFTMHNAGTGAPDLIVYRRFASGAYDLVPRWLELKVKKGKLRQSQIDWKAKAARLGIPVFTVRSLVEARAALNDNVERNRCE